MFPVTSSNYAMHTCREGEGEGEGEGERGREGGRGGGREGERYLSVLDCDTPNNT